MTEANVLKRDFVLNTLVQRLDSIQQMGVKHLALFGSVARDEADTESDLDFLVEFEAELTFDLYMDLKFFLENLFQRKVDLVIKEDLKPQLKDSILQQAIYVA
ncbi:nucleotidyltransferase family protein [[Limnothrix rosea] IAM M-220]|uniref:nucleotidyltransferase family protein n=1 Tax=[Limnothrix rosea] IAM M-220 TaxID=454133 RepID=UPI0009605906|nr:nucleotidyltransferase family protein [[Limnothrix rosea] IAM M-220]OKH14681.1 nucleotidyltransferase [[Limnothrix rosea] IAM M-220]